MADYWEDRQRIDKIREAVKKASDDLDAQEREESDRDIDPYGYWDRFLNELALWL